MKKILFLIISIFLVKVGTAQLVVLPDPNLISCLKTKYAAWNLIDASNNLRTINAKVFTQNLDCSNAQISNAEGIQYFENAFSINLSNNLLTSLPASVSNLVSVEKLILTGNNFTELPDLSGMSLLKTLLINRNKLATSKPLLATLDTLDVSANLLPDISFIAGNTNLKVLYAKDMNISSLPNFASFSNLKAIDFSGNKLDFDDLIPLSQLAIWDSSTFAVFPQQKIGTIQNLSINEGDDLVIKSTSTASLKSKWYLNAVFLIQSDSLLIKNILSTNAGAYSYRLSMPTSKFKKAFFLQSENINLSVVPSASLSISDNTIAVSENKCNKTGSISINPDLIIGGIKPFEYQLEGQSGLDYEFNTQTMRFENLKEQFFTLTIKDKIGWLLKKTIEVPQDLENCKEIVLSPEQGIESSQIYLKWKGVAKIYDRNFRLIKELPTPAFWDCTNQNGSIVNTGAYLIQVNNEINIKVSVIR